MYNIRGLFSRDAIIRYLQSLPVIKTPVMDIIFDDRPQHGLPFLGADDVAQQAMPLPVIRRGGPSISAVSESGFVAMYEPMPIRTHKFVTGADLSNLQMLHGDGQSAWAAQKTEVLRRAIRRTTEALCALSLSGAVSWPMALENGGFEAYEIEYGVPVSVDPEKLWSAEGVKLGDVFELLSDMQEALQDNGYGGTVEVWAGRAAYRALFAIAEATTSTAKMQVEITEAGINVGGFLVKRRSERYRNPQTKAMVPVVADEHVKMIATDAGHKLPYCALDDLDAKLQPMPFFVKPILKDDPSGYKLIAESKPFPVPNVKGICDAVVVA